MRLGRTVMWLSRAFLRLSKTSKRVIESLETGSGMSMPVIDVPKQVSRSPQRLEKTVQSAIGAPLRLGTA